MIDDESNVTLTYSESNGGNGAATLRIELAYQASYWSIERRDADLSLYLSTEDTLAAYQALCSNGPEPAIVGLRGELTVHPAPSDGASPARWRLTLAIQYSDYSASVDIHLDGPQIASIAAGIADYLTHESHSI